MPLWNPFRRRSTDEISEAAPAAAVAPANVARTGWEYGIGPDGLHEWQQSMGASTQTDRRSMLQQLYESFLACPWSWACVNAIARTITAGGLQFDWDNDDGEGDQEQPDKPPEVLACEKLFKFTNQREDIRQLMRSVIADLLVFGDAFIEVVWLAGVPAALYSLDAPSMNIIADAHGNITQYVQTTEMGQRAEFNPNEVIHISLDAPRSGIFGVSPTQAALLPITCWLFAAATLKETFRKGNPQAIHADLPAAMSEPEVNRWVARYMQRNVGPRNIGTPVTTRGGGTVKELSQSKIDEFLNTLNQKRDEILSCYGVPPAEAGVIESGNLGGGTGESQRKALDLATMIPTPSGWTTMGELQVGDQVLDEAGRPCNVTGTYEVPDAESWRLTFSDGTYIDCCSDHLWVTWTYEDRKAYGRWTARPVGQGVPENWPTWRNKKGSGPQVRRTAEIVETLRAYRGRANHSIPLADALELPKITDLPIDPYVLGCWLGDGTAHNATLCCADDEIIEHIRSTGEPIRKVPSGQYMWSFTDGISRYHADPAQDGTMLRRLRALGLKDNKHVPPEYLRGSVEQRLALLQGLMDTDGYHSGPAGAAQVAFCNTNERLADAVVELARSLGQKPVKHEYRSKFNGRDFGPKWEVKWTATIPAFRLSRKLAQCPPVTGHGALEIAHRKIVSAERIPNRPMRCITVDSPNEMYLAGEGMIPTHNTFMINTCGPIATLVLEKLDYFLVQQGFGIVGWHLKFAEVDMRDSQVIEQIRDMRLRNGAWTLDRYRAEIGEPPVAGGTDAVLVDRQNLVLWRDMASMSLAGIAMKTKGTSVEPAGGTGAPIDNGQPVQLQKATPPTPPPSAAGEEPAEPDPAAEPEDDAVTQDESWPYQALRETYQARLAQALRELPDASWPGPGR